MRRAQIRLRYNSSSLGRATRQRRNGQREKTKSNGSGSSREADLLLSGGTIITASAEGVIEEGELAARRGRIVALGRKGEIRSGLVSDRTKVIDCRGKYVLPGLVDCHTHLLEYAPGSIQGARGEGAARMAAESFFLAAMKIGVTSFGEHILGHPLVAKYPSEYRRDARRMPVTVMFSSGIGSVGTEPPVFTSTVTPARILKFADITDGLVRRVARAGEFPGENIFATSSPANLSIEKAPHSGEVLLNEERIRRMVSIFHSEKKRIGAHIEGVESMRAFARAGGDVIHHAHGLDSSTAKYLADSKVKVVATPAAGTRAAPNSPPEIVDALNGGVEISIATDSYIPLHKEAAAWVGVPAGSWIGPEHLLRVARGAFQALKDSGSDLNDILKIITLNPSRVIGLEKHVGSLEIGKNADVVVAKGFPGIDVLDSAGVEMVVKNGSVEIADS